MLNSLAVLLDKSLASYWLSGQSTLSPLIQAMVSDLLSVPTETM